MRLAFAFLCALFALGCSTQEVPPAFKGRMLDRTGFWAFYSGGKGFVGPVLGPGTHFTGLYNEVRVIECVEKTQREELTALTKDGVQFKLDIYTGFSVNCDDEKAVLAMLDRLAPRADEKGEDAARTIYAEPLYLTFVRPALGEAVREAVSPYIANEINGKRDELFQHIRKTFEEAMLKQNPRIIVIRAMNLSNLDFPEEFDKANAERAVQSVLRDKAIAEQERVKAEVETSQMRRGLAQAEAEQDVVRIDAIGAAYKRNPEYVTIEALHYAGEKGNMILMSTGSTPIVQLPGKR